MSGNSSLPNRTRDLCIEHPANNVYQAVKLQANASAALKINSQIDLDSTFASGTLSINESKVIILKF
jgi:cystathionine beta-lyase/cystathionine gamma-synthase